MKILISTPLFPPEISYPAQFSKSFAKHLANCGYDVVVATFSDFPEKIENVEIVHVKKSDNLIWRLIKFYFLMIKEIKKQDLVILKQAGISTFLTLLVCKFYKVKTILKLREDEVSTRIKNQRISQNSFTVWRVKKLQQFIFRNVDFILFSDDIIKQRIIKNYDLKNVSIGVLAHPEDGEIFVQDEQAKEKLDQRVKDWEDYTKEFIRVAEIENKYEK